MEFFEVEGTSLLHWRMTVAAQNEGEAIDGVRECIARCIDPGTSPVSITGLDHRVARCELAEPEELLH